MWWTPTRCVPLAAARPALDALSHARAPAQFDQISLARKELHRLLEDRYAALLPALAPCVDSSLD